VPPARVLALWSEGMALPRAGGGVRGARVGVAAARRRDGPLGAWRGRETPLMGGGFL
jgi:hypothetical protein